MASSDFIMTIDSDDEEPSHNTPKSTDVDDPHLDVELNFDFSAGHYPNTLYNWKTLTGFEKKNLRPEPISVDEILARRKLASQRMGNLEETSGGVSSVDHASDSESGDKADEASGVEADEASGVELDKEEQDPLATSDEEENGDAFSDHNTSDSDTEPETQAEKDRKAAYFDSSYTSSDEHSSFLTMNLSRPILKAIATLGYSKPTPIQAAAIPVALFGKDVVGGAVTGSGKTAAFIIPMLERLLYRDKGKKAAAIRCLILVPTRELAVQCFEVGSTLATHTDIRFCLITGGLSIKSQEAALRGHPDVLIATPGRLIDHLRNSPSFTLNALDILVLDEADRMLSDGFADELTEIIKSCPTGRQTMLFSATMTDSVDELVKMSLNRPVRLFVDPKRRTSRGLVQEFLRVRNGKEAERPALLVALCKRAIKNRVIVFFRSKKMAHQMRVVFSLLGLKCEELHGDLSQEQRLNALQKFRDGFADFLMATDLASRGLDIKGIEAVINYDMPGQLAQYLHRVGRTARSGMKGRSVTLVGEKDRKMLKAAIKHGSGRDQIRHRIIPQETVSKWAKILEGMKGELEEVLHEEKEEKQLRQAEMELKKGENIIKHEAEIFARPARTWFQSAKEKQKAESVSKKQYEEGFGKTRVPGEVVEEKKKSKRKEFAGLSRKAKRRKMAMESDKEDSGEIRAAIRSAKKASRPTKKGGPQRQFAKGKTRTRK